MEICPQCERTKLKVIMDNIKGEDIIHCKSCGLLYAQEHKELNKDTYGVIIQ